MCIVLNAKVKKNVNTNNIVNVINMLIMLIICWYFTFFLFLAHDGQEQSCRTTQTSVWFYRLCLHFCLQGII